MRLLADENTDTEWLRALSDDGHDVVRVAEFEGLRVGAPDVAVLESAASADRVVLTADQSDVADPPVADHEGVVIVADVTRSGGEVQRGFRRLERSEHDLSGRVVFLSDWL